VERADIVSGGTDIVALVRVKDVKEFDHVLLEKIQMIEGIEKTQSLIVIHE
jgi:DNA-binding Lrp family transcriptional regulator